MRALLYYFAVASSLASVASGLARGSPQTPVARVAVRDARTMAAQASVVEAAYSEDTFLSKYLERVGAQNVCADPGDLKPTLPILRAVMSAQTRAGGWAWTRRPSDPSHRARRNNLLCAEPASTSGRSS